MKLKQLFKVALSAGLLLAVFGFKAQAEISLHNAITGDPLDLKKSKAGSDTEAVKKFLENGKNPYNGDKAAVEKGHSLYLTGCSGCHGHEAEGKLGPGLADDYWTYPRNATDQGLFELLFGGANGMMGPQSLNFNNDELLQIMAWIRDVYKGDPKKAKWLK